MESQISQINLTDFSEDCIYTILDRMQIEDLHSLSFTSKRMRQMALETFYRLYHQNYWLNFWSASDELKCTMGYSNEKLGTYQRYFMPNFKKCIPNRCKR